MSYLTCLECGCTDQKTKEIDKAGGQVGVREIECAWCGVEGEVFEQYNNYHGEVNRTVRKGTFAELTTDGLNALRENLESPAFEPVE